MNMFYLHILRQKDKLDEETSRKLKLYRPLLCPAEIKGKSVTDHQQDT